MAAGLGLIALSPVLLTVAVVVWLTMGWPVLFRQVRPGLQGEPFTLLKFRTMRDIQGPNGRPVADGERMTRVGRFLRSTSLDELPELWNVLKGEMSLVGPRPLLMQYLPLYSDEQRRRHDVRPGLTGWAQVNGRNALTWEDKFDMDVWYVDHRSFLLDLRILLRTLGQVARRNGISQEGHPTAIPFRPTAGGGAVEDA